MSSEGRGAKLKWFKLPNAPHIEGSSYQVFFGEEVLTKVHRKFAYHVLGQETENVADDEGLFPNIQQYTQCLGYCIVFWRFSITIPMTMNLSTFTIIFIMTCKRKEVRVITRFEEWRVFFLSCFILQKYLATFFELHNDLTNLYEFDVEGLLTYTK